MNDTDDIVAAMLPVANAFRLLGIRYYIGGSVASSFHGATRSTMDIDVIAELDSASVTPLLQQLGNDYYSSESAIRDAVQRKACFNLIHYPSSFKVDIFVSRDRPFDRNSMTRAIIGEIGLNIKLELPMASAEDTIISKLDWYKIGNESSERQWQDVSRIMKLLGGQIDSDYLRAAAASVEVEDLLVRLQNETT